MGRSPVRCADPDGGDRPGRGRRNRAGLATRAAGSRLKVASDLRRRFAVALAEASIGTRRWDPSDTPGAGIPGPGGFGASRTETRVRLVEGTAHSEQIRPIQSRDPRVRLRRTAVTWTDASFDWNRTGRPTEGSGDAAACSSIRSNGSRSADAPASASAGTRPERDRRRLAAGRDTELADDVRDVDAGRALADEQVLGDLTVRAPIGDERQDLALARGEPESDPRRHATRARRLPVR